jgi:hypothetical protein
MEPPERCPICQVPHSFHKHGTYWRNVLGDHFEERIPVARLRCRSCYQTVSLLPTFVLPYFQYSLAFILAALQWIFVTIKTHQAQYSALFRFYKRRFVHNLNRVEMFFRDQGWSEPSPSNEHEKAKKLVCMLTVPTAETLLQRFQKHYKRNFMAR